MSLANAIQGGRDATPREVAVIITAKDAAATAARAVTSALAQRVATEVIFVDDGSSDDTAAVAESCGDGTGRLKILRLPVNRGPSFGRNLAIETATAPFFCILDADDFFADDRLARMFEIGGDGWDLLADDLILCTDMTEASAFDRLFPPDLATPCDLTLASFVRGNLPEHTRPRREIGYVKPIIRRSTWARLGVRYDENLRLGEDTVCYVNYLLGGAVFRLVESCGYYAVQRPDSLSAQHRTADLAALYEALCDLQRRPGGADLTPYVRINRNKLALREALDNKRAAGWPGFLGSLGARLDCVPHVMTTIVRDKLAAAAKPPPAASPRPLTVA